MGNLLSDIMLLGPPQSASAQVLLRSMGYHLGRWVYLVDAIDDMARDEKSASYNVLVAMGGDRNRAVDLAVQACEYAAAQAAAIFDLMDMQWAGDIISNLLYGGMPRMLMRVAPNQKQETQYT